MKMNSTPRAKTSLVSLIVLALIFVGLSAVAYPALSLGGDEYNRTSEDDKNTYASSESGLSGQVLDSETEKPIAGAEVTVSLVLPRPMPCDNNDYPEREDGKSRKGARGEEQMNRDSQGRPGNQRKEGKPCEDSWKGGRRTPDGQNNKRPDPDDTPVRRPMRLTTMTNERGYFRFQDLEGGEYLLEVFVDGNVVYSRIIKYTPNETRPLKILVRSIHGYIVAGRVVDEKKGKMRYYSIMEWEKVIETLVTYRESFPDEVVDRFTEAWLEIGLE